MFRNLIARMPRALIAILAILGCSTAWAGASVSGTILDSSVRVGRTTTDFTYRITVVNATPALGAATATVASSSAAVVVTDNTVNLGNLAAGSTTTSVDTFTIRVDRTLPFDPASLVWTVTGTPQAALPNVVSLTQAAAATALTSAGFVVGAVTTAASNTVPAGSVISQNPASGTTQNLGSAVNLVVSSGPANVNVPNVVGLTQAAASTAITGAGLVVGTVTTANSPTVPAGNVISQSPVGGTSVAPASAVNLVVSLGVANVNVPNVVGLTQAAASTAITGAGLVVGTVTTANSPTVPAGNVISQSPVGGTSVAPASAVNLVISLGVANVNVPNVVGLTQAAASTAITGAGLVVGTVTTANSPTVPAGNVISQSPVGGTSVAPGSAVNLVVSLGVANVNVPNVVGLTQAAASTAITGAGLVVGTVTTANSPTVPAGNVISQSPVGGTSVAPASAVNLVVSLGVANVNVPNVVGLTQQGAITAITNLGLVVGTVTTASSPTVPSGRVISQNPPAGTSVAPGSSVNYVVSTGPATVAVPNVVGLTQAAASTAITGAGLVVGTVTQANSNGVPAGSVISQNPAGGANVAPGSAVNLVVSLGPLLVTVPNVVGATQAAATSAITGAGLVVGNVTQANSATVPSGSVISQSPLAGASVSPGVSVDIVVSIGPANASPASLKLSLSQLIIDAGSPLTITSEVLDSAGNPVVSPPSVNYEILFDLASTTGQIPNVNVSQIVTGATTRGTFTLRATVQGTAVVSSIKFAVLKNDNFVSGSNTLLGNQMLYVNQSAAQATVTRNLEILRAAVAGGNTAPIAAAKAALAAAAASVDPQQLSFSTPYAPDTGFLPTTAQLGAHGITQSAADIAFGNLTTQFRTKVQQITALLSAPSGNQAANDATLTQYWGELQTLTNSLQLAANTPGTFGLIKNAAAVNDMLSKDMPLLLRAIVSRVNGELTLNGFAGVQGAPRELYRSIDGAQDAQLASLSTVGAMYRSQRDTQFFLGGLLSSCGIIGDLIQRIYGPYLQQLQTMMILLATQSILNAVLPPGPVIDTLITGASQSFHVYHAAGTTIEVTGSVSLAQVGAGDVYLIGGAAVNAVQSLATTIYSARNIRSVAQLREFYDKMGEAIAGGGQAIADAHQQPNSVENAGECLLTGSSPCFDMVYNAGFNYVGSGGGIGIEPVIVLIKINDPVQPGYGLQIYNFVGR